MLAIAQFKHSPFHILSQVFFMMAMDIPTRQSDSRFLSHSRRELENRNYIARELIGTGRSGDVYMCWNLSTEKRVAIKIITILKEDKRNGVPYSIIREVSALRELDHVNIVKLLEVINFGDDLYLVFEYISYDLQRFVGRGRTLGQPGLVKNILHQILSAVAYCHSHKILHRDLKPQNVLLNLDTLTVALKDFGVARPFDVPLSYYSNEVGSLHYMAPELLFGYTKYSTPVDIWSAGCIFAELVNGRPLFTGARERDVLKEILSLVGTPTEKTWPGLSRLTSVCDFIEILGRPMKPKDLAAEFPTLEPTGVDLLSKMLCLCPNYRISAEEAENHPYFNDVREKDTYHEVLDEAHAHASQEGIASSSRQTRHEGMPIVLSEDIQEMRDIITQLNDEIAAQSARERELRVKIDELTGTTVAPPPTPSPLAAEAVETDAGTEFWTDDGDGTETHQDDVPPP